MTHHSVLSSVKKGLLLLAIPVIELVFFRFYLHFFLKLHLSFANFTDFDLIIPGPIAFLLLMSVLEKEQIARIAFRKTGFLWNLGFFVAFLAVNQNYLALAEKSAGALSFIWFFLLGGLFLSAFSILVNPRFFLKNRCRLAFFPATCVALSVTLNLNYFGSLWKALLIPTKLFFKFSASIFAARSLELMVTQNNFIRASNGAFSILIGQGCGGIDGILLFTSAYSLAVLISPSILKSSRWVLYYGVGLVYIFFLNLLRLVMLFDLGVWLQRWLGTEVGSRILIQVFHLHLGWILYTLGIGVYFTVIFWKETSPINLKLRPAKAIRL